MQLGATLTLNEAQAAVQVLRAAAAQSSGGTLRIDASALKIFDSAALAVLLQARRLARAAGAGFELHGADDRLVQLANLYGVARLLGMPAAG